MIYAMSDIHGRHDLLRKALNYIIIDLEFDPEVDRIVFIGDYIDRGPDGYQVLELIHTLQNKTYSPESIIVLKGNHDEMLMAWLRDQNEILHLVNDRTLTTIKSFLPKTKWKLSFDGIIDLYDAKTWEIVTRDVAATILRENKELLEWYDNLQYYYEVGDVIFVHAGLDEIPGKDWKESSKETMTWKWPETYGFTPWNKKIVAGHINTRNMSMTGSNKIYRSKDHIYIDGGASHTGVLNILGYNPEKELFYDARTMEIIPE